MESKLSPINGVMMIMMPLFGQRAKKVLSDRGLVEMTSGLVNASFSLPEWEAVKMIFFTPCWGKL